MQVTGSAIALNLLFHIPLVGGCLITMADVLVTVLFYRPDGSMLGLRAFEFFVVALVMGVVICFCIQLSLIESQSVGEVLKGYLPSAALVQSKGYVYHVQSPCNVTSNTREPACIKAAVFSVRQSCLIPCSWAVVSSSHA